MHCYLAVQFREMRTKALFTKENPCMTRTISPGRGAFDIDEGTTQLSLGVRLVAAAGAGGDRGGVDERSPEVMELA